MAVKAGGDKVYGNTRRAVVQQRQGLRHEVLAKAWQARPVTVYQSFEKISVAWLLALSGHDTGLSSPVFTQAMAAHLCLHSPAVGWVGKVTVRDGDVIDKFGDAIINCKHLPGDTWRARHDTGKLAIVNECINANLVHDCEVY